MYTREWRLFWHEPADEGRQSAHPRQPARPMAADAADARLTWLEDWLVLKLGIKGEKFRRLVASEEGGRVSGFLDRRRPVRLPVRS